MRICKRCGYKHTFSNARRFVALINKEKAFYLCFDCLESTNLIFDQLPNFNKYERWVSKEGVIPIMTGRGTGLATYSYNPVDVVALVVLQRHRSMIAEKFTILNAYDIIGHAPDSFHYYGQAVDFYIGDNPKKDSKFLEHYRLLDKHHFGGLGVYPYHWRPYFHIDVRDKNSRWFVNKDGIYIYKKPGELLYTSPAPRAFGGFLNLFLSN